uniref:Outer coat protein n=1 Tax=Bactrocera tryoni rhabdovirus 1 TaxID=2795014 RepID=A0A8A6RDN6_9RHAB|nr:outer coat protein [Bactrocera tryoni rhabdovirus 1]
MSNFRAFNLFLISIFISNSYSDIVYPTEITTNWLPANFSKIQCPNSIYHLTLEHQQDKIPIYIFKPNSIKKLIVTGLLCHKVKKITHCNENWLFISEITHEIFPSKISKGECEEAISDHLQGREIEDSYPLPSCAWNTINSVSRNVIYLTEHSVRYDQYSMSYVDGIFLNGRTKTLFSHTIYDSTMWKANPIEQSLYQCVELESEPGYLYQYNEQWFIWGDTLKEQLLSDMCELSYCGYHGLLSKTGEWIYIEQKSNKSLIRQLIRSRPYCKKDVDIREEYKSQQTNTGLMNTMGLMIQMRCNEILNKLLTTNSINNIDISYLVQQHQGVGPVYKLENNSLYVTTGVYKIVNTTFLNKKPLLLGTGLDNQQIYLTSFRRLTKNLSYGWNGIILYKNQIILPLNNYYSYEINQVLSDSYPLKVLTHPVFHISPLKIFESNATFSNSPNRTDLPNVLLKFSESVYQKLERWVNRVFSSFNGLSIIIYSIIILITISVILHVKPLYLKSKKGSSNFDRIRVKCASDKGQSWV